MTLAAHEFEIRESERSDLLSMNRPESAFGYLVLLACAVCSHNDQPFAAGSFLT